MTLAGTVLFEHDIRYTFCLSSAATKYQYVLSDYLDGRIISLLLDVYQHDM